MHLFLRQAASLGGYVQAREHLEQALACDRETGRPQENFIFSSLAFVCAEQGEESDAASCLEQSLALPCPHNANEKESLYFQSYALVELGRPAEAQVILQKAIPLWQDQYPDGVKLETLTVLARACLALGDRAGALAQVEAVLASLARGETLYGAYLPVRVYLTCYQILAAHQDPRAVEVLQAGYVLLQEIAAKIPDEGERRSFLENVPWHRELSVAWEARGAGAI